MSKCKFGVIPMVGGSIPGKTRVSSIAIFEAVEAMHHNQAASMSMALVTICYLVLISVNLSGRKKACAA